MRPLLWVFVRRTTLICGMLLILSYSPSARADDVRKKKESTFSLPLQPFSLSPTATDKAAAPATGTAPHILRAIKAEPVRAAYFNQRRRIPRTPRIHRNDYDQLEDTHGDSIRVAYQTAR